MNDAGDVQNVQPSQPPARANGTALRALPLAPVAAKPLITRMIRLLMQPIVDAPVIAVRHLTSLDRRMS
jgi:hypothetical protein